MTPTIETEESLDPQEWNEIRRIGHKMLDDMIDHMASVRERPVWRSLPEYSAAALSENIPMEGAALSDVYETFQKHILPYPTGNAHPRFWGWVMGNGTATGMLADMLASGMNAHLAGYDQAASFVERQVIRWLCGLTEFPETSSGLLVSGATMANLNGLVVARNEKAGFDVREEGLHSKDAPALRVYGSAETHSWIYKACELMGLGRQAFAPVPVNENYEIDIATCKALIERDISHGVKPFCLIGTAGTVNTGAVDDLAGLRKLANDYDLWLHIDGAFGSLAALSEKSRHLVSTQSAADSIAFDLHKWGFMPYEIGCVLVRDGETQHAAFSTESSYLSSFDRGLSVNATYFADRGLQLTRGFRALKAWMSLKEQGVRKIGRIIQQNIDQAGYLGDLVESHAKLQLLAPIRLNIVCFRFFAASLSNNDLNKLNREILLRIQESGVAAPSQTVLNDKFAIRACITNHRTRKKDLDMLIEAIEQHASDILGDEHPLPN